MLRVAAATDLFLYDLKVMDPDRHTAFTGVPLAPILRNLRALDAAGAEVWLRLPLVPGHNDDDANLEAVAGLAVRGARALGDKLAAERDKAMREQIRPSSIVGEGAEEADAAHSHAGGHH